MKLLHQGTTFVTGYAAAEQHVAPVALALSLAQAARNQFVRSEPLAEDHRLGRRVFKQFVQHGHQLIDLAAVIGFVIKQKGAVARHAHVLQGTVQAALVGVREVARLAPALNDARDDAAILIVVHALLWRQRHKDAVVHALRQLRQNLGLASAQHNGGQRLADAVQCAVANHAAGFVARLVLVKQAPGGAKPVLVHKLHDGNQLFEPVFQRRAGQHYAIGADDALQGARGDGVPVLDALRLVGNYQVGRPVGDQVSVARQRLVVGDLAEGLFAVLLLTPCAQTADHLHIAFGKALELVLPLVFERGRTDHQHAAHAKVLREQLGSSDGLNCFAQTHLVADQAAPGAGCKQCAF